MYQNETGSKTYLAGIVMVAVLGGLLFGYDTAVISGAEKGLQAFFLGAKDFQYTDVMHGFTSSSALIGCIIGFVVYSFPTTSQSVKERSVPVSSVEGVTEITTCQYIPASVRPPPFGPAAGSFRV